MTEDRISVTVAWDITAAFHMLVAFLTPWLPWWRREKIKSILTSVKDWGE
jgi:hypothetical protein